MSPETLFGNNPLISVACESIFPMASSPEDIYERVNLH